MHNMYFYRNNILTTRFLCGNVLQSIPLYSTTHLIQRSKGQDEQYADWRTMEEKCS